MAKFKNDCEKLLRKTRLLNGGSTPAVWLDSCQRYSPPEGEINDLLREVVYNIITMTSRWNCKFTLSLDKQRTRVDRLHRRYLEALAFKGTKQEVRWTNENR